MELIPEIVSRRARRAIDEKPVHGDVIRRVLDAALLSPSCFNKQSWRFLVLDKRESLSIVTPHLSEGNYWARRSPCIVLALTKPELGCVHNDRREYALFDTGMACMNLMLQATREGLYAHPIAGFEPAGIKKALFIPDDYILITLIVMGYPGNKESLNEKHKAIEEGPGIRRAFEESVWFNEWPS